MVEQDLDAHPVGAAQAAGIAGLLELGVGAGDDAALVAAAADAREALDRSAASTRSKNGCCSSNSSSVLGWTTSCSSRVWTASFGGRDAKPMVIEQDGGGGEAGDDQFGGI